MIPGRKGNAGNQKLSRSFSVNTYKYLLSLCLCPLSLLHISLERMERLRPRAGT